MSAGEWRSCRERAITTLSTLHTMECGAQDACDDDSMRVRLAILTLLRQLTSGTDANVIVAASSAALEEAEVLEPTASPPVSMMTAAQLVRRFNTCKQYCSVCPLALVAYDAVGAECDLLKAVVLQVTALLRDLQSAPFFSQADTCV